MTAPYDPEAAAFDPTEPPEEYPPPGYAVPKPPPDDEQRYLTVRMRRPTVGPVSGAVAGAVLTPVAIGLTVFGASSMVMLSPLAGTYQVQSDLLGMACLLLGALLFLAIAASAVLSPAGPLVGGVLWGVLPGLIQPFDPRFVETMHTNTYGLISEKLGIQVFGATVLGLIMAVGVLLIAAGVVAVQVRRRTEAAVLARLAEEADEQD